MLVMEHQVGRDPTQDSWIQRAVGSAGWRRLLQDLAAVPAVTLPPGWEFRDGRVEVSVEFAPGQVEALMRSAGPRGGRPPR